jgi:hypothetical protein
MIDDEAPVETSSRGRLLRPGILQSHIRGTSADAGGERDRGADARRVPS